MSPTLYQVVDTESVWDTLDHVHDAKSAAIAEGAELTHIVLAPDVALALAKAKQASGSNMGLLETVDDGIKLAGLVALVSPHVTAGNAWAVDQSQIMVVRRMGTTLATSKKTPRSGMTLSRSGLCLGSGSASLTRRASSVSTRSLRAS